MNSFKKSYRMFKKICTPAQLYFILGLIGILASLQMKFNLNLTVLNVLTLLLWTFLLNMFCNWGWSSLSWFLVLFPYVLLLLLIFVTPLFLKDKEEKEETEEKEEEEEVEEEKKELKGYEDDSIQNNLINTHRMVHLYDNGNL